MSCWCLLLLPTPVSVRCVDSGAVELLHSRLPKWPLVWEYALRLERGDPPPPVQVLCALVLTAALTIACQLSRHPIFGLWVANDGAHRYLSRVAISDQTA